MDFIRSIREGLKDPKKKSLTLLGMYGIFFIFVFAVLNSSGTPSNYIPEEPTEKSVESYEYVYKLINNQDIMEIHGTIKGNDEVFTYNGLNYHKDSNGFYVLEDNTISRDISPYINITSYSDIETFIKNSNFISETRYNDNSKKAIYDIVASKYFDLENNRNFNNTESDVIDVCGMYDCNKGITITVESGEYINHAVIDFSNFYGHLYNIDITFSNVNNIQELKISTN